MGNSQSGNSKTTSCGVDASILLAQVSVLLVGLDNSGKSTIVNQLRKRKDKLRPNQITPTVGFKQESIVWAPEACQLTIWDMSGQSRYRPLWHHYFEIVSGIIFVVDLSDRARMSIVKDELDRILQHKKLEHKPILFLANKVDHPDAVSPEDIWVALRLGDIEEQYGHVVHIKKTNGLSGEGVKAGLEWLATFMRPDYR